MNIIKERVEKWHYGILVLILLLAFCLRLVGINWGLPNTNLHPDEGLIFSPAYQCALNRSFEVRDYYRPNHVTIKISALLYVGIQELYFAPQGQDDFAVNYSENEPIFITASRLVTTFFGLITVILMYLIVKNWGRSQALLAAFLAAVFSSFLEHSHYITPDIPLLCLLMAVLWASLCYLKRPSYTWLFWMCFFTALAACEKYPGAYGCVVIAITVIVTHYREPFVVIKRGFLAVLFCLLGVLAVSPVLLLDYKSVLEIIAGQNKQYHLGADGLNFGQSVIFYAKTTITHLGMIMSACSLYGMLKSCKRNPKPTIVVIGFLAYIIPISTLSVHWERYTLPIYAVGLIFGSIGIFYLPEEVKKVKISRTAGISVAIATALLISIGSLCAGAAAVTCSFLAPDSRIVLKEEFEDMNVNASNTVYDCNTPLDPGGFYGAFCNFENSDPAQFKYGRSPLYVMTSSAQRDLYLEAKPEIYGWIADFYRNLDQNYPLVYLYPVEKPQSYFLELQNIYYAARSVYRYLFKHAAVGYEIRLYQLVF